MEASTIGQDSGEGLRSGLRLWLRLRLGIGSGLRLRLGARGCTYDWSRLERERMQKQL